MLTINEPLNDICAYNCLTSNCLISKDDTIVNYDSCHKDEDIIIYIDAMVPIGLHEAADHIPSNMHEISIFVGT